MFLTTQMLHGLKVLDSVVFNSNPKFWHLNIKVLLPQPFWLSVVNYFCV